MQSEDIEKALSQLYVFIWISSKIDSYFPNFLSLHLLSKNSF